ncbi:hypothetical protein ACHAPT_005397 [Fusarium lateritium]
MRAVFGTVLAVLVTPIIARGVYLSGADFKPAPPVRRDMLQKRADMSEDINWSKVDDDIINPGAQDNKLQLHCNKCELTGRVDADFEEKILDPLASAFKISFAETKGHVDMKVVVGSGTEQVIPLWNNQGLPTDSVQGLGLFLEMVVSLDGELEATGGFDFTIPEGSWLSVDLKGDIVETSFDGAGGNSLEWDLASGSSTLKVSLRLRTQIGVDIKVIDLPSAAVGVYLNLIELVVDFERDDSNAVCVLEATETFNINAGVYANVDVDIGQVTLGVNPTVSTTLFAGPTAAQCLESAKATGGDAIVTTTEGGDAAVTTTEGDDAVVTTTEEGGAVPTDDCVESSQAVESGANPSTASPDEPEQTPTASTLVTLVSSRRVATVTEHVVVTVTEVAEGHTTLCPEDE